MLRLCSATYQILHSSQRVVGIVQRVGQLVDAVVGLTVAVEAKAHCHAASRQEAGRVSSQQRKVLQPEPHLAQKASFPLEHKIKRPVKQQTG